ncbi:MAG TPA: hypothetical protein VIL34_13395 [Actinopolymorphaceae bacterium]|jgi:hypothetical protein
MNVWIRNLLFTIVVPGSAAVWFPWWVLTRGKAHPNPPLGTP